MTALQGTPPRGNKEENGMYLKNEKCRPAAAAKDHHECANEPVSLAPGISLGAVVPPFAPWELNNWSFVEDHD